MERWFSTDYSTTVCRNLMIRSADPAWNFNFDRIKEKKCDKGGKNESLFFSSNFHKGRADSAHGSSPCPCQGRSPWRSLQAWQSWFSLQPFPTSYVLELEDASSHRIGSLLPNPLLFSTWGTHHSVLGALGAVLVIPLDEVHEIFDTLEFAFVWWTAVHQLRANLNLMAFLLSKLTS